MELSISLSVLVIIIELTLVVLAIQYFERTVYFILNKENAKALNCFLLGWCFALLCALIASLYVFHIVV